eukprot:5703485-Lingulodinium_polyedra.AAC.1
MRVDHTHAVLTTKCGAPLWKNVVYRTVIDIDTQEGLEDMRSVEGFSDKELRKHLGARPRNLRTILYHKAAVFGTQSEASRLREGGRP